MRPVFVKSKPEVPAQVVGSPTPLHSKEAEELLASHLLKTHIVLPQQIQDARDSQRLAGEFNMQLSLGEALVKLGAITAAQRSNIEAHLQEELEKTKQIGHFRLGALLGAGAMGKVYRAEDTVARREVAIKILAEEYAKHAHFLKRFQNEARALGKLNHPNIVAAFDVGEDNGRHYVVMELCEGQSLEVRLKNKQPIPVNEALEYALQSAQGLEHAHDRGLIHRDIKPGNILVSKEGVAKILDLGLSKNTEDTDGYTTAQGMTVGTPHYMSPEQARASATTDHRTDIYSLGVTLFHMLTGSPPFVAKTPEKIMEKHLKERAPKPSEIHPDIPACVDALVLRMMSKRPDDRHSDCEMLIADIRRVMQGKMPLEMNSTHAPSIKRKGDSNIQKSANTPVHGSHARIERPPSGERSKSAAVALWQTPYFRYGAVAALAVLGGLYFFMMERPGTEAAKKIETPDEPPPVAAVAPKPAVPAVPEKSDKPEKPKPKDPPKEPRVVSVLESAEPGRNTVQGRWEVLNGELQGEGWGARIEIPYSPPEEYDLRVQFTRVSGNDSVMIALSYNNQGFAWKMGDHANTIAGFETLNGMNSSDGRNPTRKQQSGWLTTGQRSTALIEVRKNSVKAYLNGRPMTEFDPTQFKLDQSAPWKMRDGRILGVGCWNSKTIFHEIKVTEITGTGRFFR